MKVLKIPQSAQHLILLEKDDRFVQLTNMETAVVLDQPDNGDIKVVVHYPKLEEGMEVPLNVMLSACVQEFLNDPELVQQMQERLQKKQSHKQA